MHGRNWNVLAMLMVAMLGLAACGGDAGDTGDTDTGAMPAEEPAAQTGDTMEVPANLPEGVTQEQVAQGRQIFTGQGGCQACHGPDATGTQLAPDLTDDEWLNVSGPDLDEVVELIKTGVPQPVEHPAPMPPMGGASLTDEQVRAVAAYVVSLSQG